MVVDRIREAEAPNKFRILWPPRFIVIHRTSLAKREVHNPEPIADADLDVVGMADRFCRGPMKPYTGGAFPYHFVVRRDPDATVEQALPLMRAGAHAKGYNHKSIGVAYVCDESGPGPTHEQRRELVKLCRLLVIITGGALVVGHHPWLEGSSSDPKKVCPHPSLDIKALAREVRNTLPDNWRTWAQHAKETQILAAGIVVDIASEKGVVA